MKILSKQILAVVAALQLLLVSGGGTANVHACSTADCLSEGLDQRLFLPSIQTPGARVSGRVLSSQASTAGATVQLRSYRRTWSDPSTLVASTTLGEDGSYVFTQVPALSADSAYYVFYTPDRVNPALLMAAYSADVTALTAEQSVDLGILDVTGVVLKGPADQATVGMPATFDWAPRSTQSDIYYWHIYDSSGGLGSLSTEDLGYVGQVVIEAFPGEAGYQTHAIYRWNIGVLMPDGSEGFSQARQISFSNIMTWGAPIERGAAFSVVTPATADRPHRTP